MCPPTRRTPPRAPQPEEAPGALLEALAPFQAMLQAGVAPLLAPGGPGGGAPAAALGLVLKVLRRLRFTRDAAVRGGQGGEAAGAGAGEETGQLCRRARR